ncbi:MAG: DUF6580 family putative transport protein [Candidatus Jorgensenbacteria bacterium]
MKLKNNNLILALIVIISVASVALRLLPHLPNFAPIGALALFVGIYAKKKIWFLAPIAAMFFSDLVIGFDSWKMRVVVYGSFLVYVLLGVFAGKNKSFGTVVGGTLAGALFFYLSTNFTVWAFSGMYLHTFQGLILCYEMALPFFRNTLAGDLFYVGSFVGAYEFVYWLFSRRLLFFRNRRALEIAG